MTESQTEQLWLKHLSADLQGDDAKQLHDRLRDHPESLELLLDDRSVDSLLNQIYQTNDEGSFVASCTDEFESVAKSKNVLDAGHQSNRQENIGPAIQIAEPVPKRALTTSKQFRRNRRLQQVMIWTAIAAVFAAIAVGGILLQLDYNGEQTPIVEQSDIHPTDPRRSDVVQPDLVGPELAQSDSAQQPLPEVDSTTAGNMDDQSIAVRGDVKTNMPLPEDSRSAENGAQLPGTGAPEDVVANNSEANVVSPNEPPTTPASMTFVESENVKWHKQKVTPEGLGTYLVESGELKLVTKDGSHLKLFGPAEVEVKPDDVVYIKQGMVSAKIGNDANLSLVTPQADLEKTNSSEFQLHVDDSGRSEIFVQDGSLDFIQRVAIPEDVVRLGGREEGKDFNKIKLRASRLNQAVAEVVELPIGRRNSLNPSVCMAQGNGGFSGQININGDLVLLDSPQKFSQIMNEIAATNQRDLAFFQEEWHIFARQLGAQQGIGNMPSDLGSSIPELDGFFRDFENRIKEMQRQSENPRDVRNSGSTNFQGVINVNGREVRFSSQEDFDRAMSEAPQNSSRNIKPPGIQGKRN